MKKSPAAVSSPAKKPAPSNSSASSANKRPPTAVSAAAGNASTSKSTGTKASSMATPARPGTSSVKPKESTLTKKPAATISSSGKSSKTGSSSSLTKPASKSTVAAVSSPLKASKSGKSPLASKESLISATSKKSLNSNKSEGSQEFKSAFSLGSNEGDPLPLTVINAEVPVPTADNYEDDFEQYEDDFETFEEDTAKPVIVKTEPLKPAPAIVIHESEPVFKSKPETSYEEDFEQYESDFESFQEDDEKSSQSQKSVPPKPVQIESYRLVPSTQQVSVEEKSPRDPVNVTKKKPVYTGKMISCKRWLELKKYIEFEQSRTINMLDIIYGRDNTTNKFYNLQPRQTQYPSMEGEEADIKETGSQTERIETGDKWSQIPAGFSQFANDSGVPVVIKAKDRFKAPAKPKIRDFQTLNRFVLESGNLMESLWSEERYGALNGNGEEDLGNFDYSVAGLSTHFVPVDISKIGENRRVLDIGVSNDYIMVSLSKSNGYAFVALYSRVNFKLLKLLHSGSQISCIYCNSSLLPDFIIGGADDGSIVVWDLSSKQAKRTVDLYPTYIRCCDVKGTNGHLEAIRSLEIYGDSNSYLELVSFDIAGKAIIWRIVIDGDSTDFGCSYGHTLNLVFVTLLNTGSKAVRLSDGSFACSDGSEGSLYRLNRYNSRMLPLSYQTWFSSFGRKCTPAIVKPMANSNSTDFLVAFIEGYVASYNKDEAAFNQVWFVDFSSVPKNLEISFNLKSFAIVCESDIYMMPAEDSEDENSVRERSTIMPWSKEGLPGADTISFRKLIWTNNLFSDRSSRMLVWVDDDNMEQDRIEWHSVAI